MTNNKIDLTKPYQCRNGDAAEVVCTDLEGEFPWLVVRTSCATGKKYPCLVDEKGKHYKVERKHDYDLINLPEKRVYWVNFYDGYATSHLTEEIAKKYAGYDALKTAVRIEIEV